MLNENFFYAGLNALSNGICLQKPITFTGAEPDVETIHVPGRNGDLSIYTGAYKNRKGTVRRQHPNLQRRSRKINFRR